RIALNPFDVQGEFDDVLPGVDHLLEKKVGDSRHQAEFDLGERTPGGWTRVVASPQQPVDDGEEERGVDVEDELPLERLGIDEVEAGGILEAEDELAVGKLVDAGELDLDD